MTITGGRFLHADNVRAMPEVSAPASGTEHKCWRCGAKRSFSYTDDQPCLQAWGGGGTCNYPSLPLAKNYRESECAHGQLEMVGDQMVVCAEPMCLARWVLKEPVEDIDLVVWPPDERDTDGGESSMALLGENCEKDHDVVVFVGDSHFPAKVDKLPEIDRLIDKYRPPDGA